MTHLNLHEMVPEIKPGSVGLFHIGSRETRQLGMWSMRAFVRLVEEAAEKAGVSLVTKTVNRVLMIAWVPK